MRVTVLVAVVVFAVMAAGCHLAAAAESPAPPPAPTPATAAAVGAPAVTDCSVFTDCKSCAVNAGCSYCSHYGSTLSGSCFNSTQAATACPFYRGSTVQSTYQCAPANVTCASYQPQSSNLACFVCASAPTELNCGWCADWVGVSPPVSRCLSGSPGGSNIGNCLSGTWGFQSTACETAEAECNSHSGEGCQSCLNQPGCGYCATTGRCEKTDDGVGTGPTANDCPLSNFTTIAGLCPAASDPCANYNSDCSGCMAWTSSQDSCGYCAATGKCQAGNWNGPLVGSSCPSSSWTAPGSSSCPTVNTCGSITDCTKCTSQPQCGYCNYPQAPGAGLCLPSSGAVPAPGYQCSGQFEIVPQQCGHTPPSPPSPGPDAGADWPDAATTAVIMMTLTSLLLALRLLLLSCCARRYRPMFGARLTPGVARYDYATPCMRLVPACCAGMTLALKLTAMGLDTWDILTKSAYGRTASAHYGLFRIWTRTDVPGQSDQTLNYRDECQALDDLDMDGEFAACQIKRAAGILTLIVGVSACASALIVCMATLYVLFVRTRFASTLVLLWRFSSLAMSFSIASVWYWSWCAHTIIHHQDNDEATLGVSWILMLVSWVCDLVLVIFYRIAIRRTVAPPRAGAAGAGTGAALPSAYGGYAPLGGGSGGVSQPQAAVIAPDAPGVLQVPYGYGAPVHYHHQPAAGTVAVGQPPVYYAQQIPPAGMPYAQQQQQPQPQAAPPDGYQPPRYAAPPVVYANTPPPSAPPRA